MPPTAISAMGSANPSVSLSNSTAVLFTGMFIAACALAPPVVTPLVLIRFVVCLLIIPMAWPFCH